MNSINKVFAVIILLLFITTCSQNKAEYFKDSISNFYPAYIKDPVYLDSQNTFSIAKATLGRYLFYDRRLSVNNTKACASCHAQQFAFTDSYSRSIGSMGDLHQRNSKPLVNIIFEKYLTSADSTLHFPEYQLHNPMFNTDPIEMGWAGNEKMIIERIKKVALYDSLFKVAFPSQTAFTIKNIQFAISSFVKTITSFNSPYDRFLYQNDSTALSPSQKKGMVLFNSSKLNCSFCHGGPNFSKPSLQNHNYYFNTGILKSAQLPIDSGLYVCTKKPMDIGAFKVPTLRNLAFTAPYFHNGSVHSLYDVIAMYEGASSSQPNDTLQKNQFISGFKLTSQERDDLVAFLLSLSDSSVIVNPQYANPFSEDETNSSYK